MDLHDFFKKVSRNSYAIVNQIFNKPNFVIYRPSEFDHTIGCYISDYILAVFIIYVLINFGTGPRRFVDSATKFLCYTANIATAYSAVAGGLVHHFYKLREITNARDWSFLWNSAVYTQLLSAFCVTLILLFHNSARGCISYIKNNYLIVLFSAFSIFSFYISFFNASAFELQLIIISLVFIGGFVRQLTVYIKNLDNVFVRERARNLLLSIIFYAGGVLIRMRNVSFHPEYCNKNVLFHICIALTSFFFTWGVFR